MDLLQIATGITKCDDYYKLRQYTGGENKFLPVTVLESPCRIPLIASFN